MAAQTDAALPEEDHEAISELLRALGHGTRLQLLSALKAGERSVGEIETVTGVAQPGLSQQLAILRKAELVTTRREAKLVYYSINRARMGEIARFIDQLGGTMQPGAAEAPAGRMGRGGAATFARVETPGPG